MFTYKAVDDKTYIRKSVNVCKSTVGIEASQLYPESFCQPMPTRLYTRCEVDADLQRFKPKQNKSRNSENMDMLFFQRMKVDCRIEKFYLGGTQKKIDDFNADGFCGHFNTMFDAMGSFFHYTPCQEAPPAWTEETVNEEQKRGKWMKCGNSTSRRKVSLLPQCGNVNGGNSTRLTCQ